MAAFLEGTSTPCSRGLLRRFGRTYRLHAEASTFTRLSHPQYGGSAFLRNVRTRVYCMAREHRESDFHQAMLNTFLTMLLTFLYLLSLK